MKVSRIAFILKKLTKVNILDCKEDEVEMCNVKLNRVLDELTSAKVDFMNICFSDLNVFLYNLKKGDDRIKEVLGNSGYTLPTNHLNRLCKIHNIMFQQMKLICEKFGKKIEDFPKSDMFYRDRSVDYDEPFTGWVMIRYLDALFVKGRALPPKKKANLDILAQLHNGTFKFKPEIESIMDDIDSFLVRIHKYVEKEFGENLPYIHDSTLEYCSLKGVMNDLDEYDVDAFREMSCYIFTCMKFPMLVLKALGIKTRHVLYYGLNQNPVERFYKKLLDHMYKFILNSRNPISPRYVRHAKQELLDVGIVKTFAQTSQIMQSRYFKLLKDGQLEGLDQLAITNKCIADYLNSIIEDDHELGPAYAHIRLLIRNALDEIVDLEKRFTDKVTVYGDKKRIAVLGDYQSIHEFKDGANVDRILTLLPIPKMISAVQSKTEQGRFGVHKNFIPTSKGYKAIEKTSFFDEMRSHDILTKEGVDLRDFIGYESGILMRLQNSSKKNVLLRILNVLVDGNRANTITTKVLDETKETDPSLGFNGLTQDEWLIMLRQRITEKLSEIGKKMMEGGFEAAVKDQGTCCICFDELTSNNSQIVCKNAHILCKKCSSNKKLLKNKCPTCRSELIN